MKLDPDGIAARTIFASISSYPRIIKAGHATTPAGAGFGSSRFSSPTGSFRLLYAAADFRTAFAEAVVRDRFVSKARRYLYRPFLESLMVTEIGSSHDLQLLDFRGAAAYELGVDTDAKGARVHAQGQRFAEALHAQTLVDGILFDSRLAHRDCIAVFDRAFGKLTATTPVDIVRLSALYDELLRMRIVVRRKRGI